MMVFKNWKNIILLVLGIALVYFPVFLKLDYLPFRMWDEARPAVHAYEMIKSHNYLVTTYNGGVDMWYTKPPMMVWFQVLCIKILGYNELAIRLPSALAAVCTCLLICVFLYKNTKSLLFGVVSMLVLVTTTTYISVHGSRTGDVDVLLTFFLTLSAFSLFNFVEFGKRKYIYLLFLGLACAILSKGIAGLFFTPAFFIFLLLQKRLINTLKNIHFYISLFAFLLIIGGYYFYREAVNPGYLQAVWDNELLGRYGETIEGHKHDFLFYINRIVNLNNPLWLILFPIGLFMGIYNLNAKIKKVIVFCGVIILQYIFLISLSETKPYWYDIPIYPFWAIIIGLSIYSLFVILSDKIDVSGYFKYNFFPFAFLFIAFYMPYTETFNRVGKKGEPEFWDDKEYALSYYLQNAVKNKTQNLDGVLLSFEGYEGHFIPYKYLLAERGEHIGFIWQDAPANGKKVLAHQDVVKDKIEQSYVYEVLDTFRNVKLYRILDRK